MSELEGRALDAFRAMIAMLNYGVDNDDTTEDGPDPTETEVMAKWLSEFIRDDEGLRLLNEANQRIIVALLLKLSTFGVSPRDVIAEISARFDGG
jgi:hypothetical protein